MAFYANPAKDLPAPWEEKRIIFYAEGLKIYGQIPYILQRKLQAEFISNDVVGGMGRLIGPSGERNYTLVPYRREDGERHSESTIEALLDWLYEDRGFEWAIAAPGEFERRDLRLVNWFQSPPETIVPAGPEHRQLIRRLLLLEEGRNND